MEQAKQTRVTRAIGNVWERFADTLKHFAEKMADGDAVFRDSTVRNLREIVDLLPDLNFVNDPDIERLRLEVMAAIDGVDAPLLRTNKAERARVAAETAKIMDDMAGFMAAFGGGS
jgi:hypothetical protein